MNSRKEPQSSPPVVVWFRRDLRLSDHPALAAACDTGQEVFCLFCWDEATRSETGAASRVALHKLLEDLAKQLLHSNTNLHVVLGEPEETLLHLHHESGASEVFVNACHEPAVDARDRDLRSRLAAKGLSLNLCEADTLFDLDAVRNGKGDPYRVFTPFYKACLKGVPPLPPLPAPTSIRGWNSSKAGQSVDSLQLLPTIPWDRGFDAFWKSGRSGADERLQQFVERKLRRYAVNRDFPGEQGTSRLSVDLHFGVLSPRECWSTAGEESSEPFRRQLVWRDFSLYLLKHFPATVSAPLNPAFASFPWESNLDLIGCWQKGTTGYPLVDAGMRELWSTGWMHNRVRMVVGSFLVKNLMASWTVGRDWFADTLLDADLANNTFGWQWVAGCGADAAPYFRIFNPVTQSRKFDSEGAYIRRWVPELSELPDKWIHAPWEVGGLDLAAAGVRLGDTYPFPVVDHSIARDKALDAYHATMADYRAKCEESA